MCYESITNAFILNIYDKPYGVMNKLVLDSLLYDVTSLFNSLRKRLVIIELTDDECSRFNYCIDTIILQYEKTGYYKVKSYLKKNKIIMDEIDLDSVDFVCGESCYSESIPFVTIEIYGKDYEYLYPYYVIKNAVEVVKRVVR